MIFRRRSPAPRQSGLIASRRWLAVMKRVRKSRLYEPARAVCSAGERPVSTPTPNLQFVGFMDVYLSSKLYLDVISKPY